MTAEFVDITETVPFPRATDSGPDLNGAVGSEFFGVNSNLGSQFAGW